MTPRYLPMEFKISRVGERAVATINAQKADDLRNYWHDTVRQSSWYDPDKEHLVVVLLNTKLRITGHALISIGTLNESLAHPREILKPVIVLSAFAFVLMHNHPSGDCAPSEADRRLTSKLIEAAKMMQLTLIDHVIYGTSEHHFSFREAGIL